jgi:glutaconate CoA-transferase subunit B
VSVAPQQRASAGEVQTVVAARRLREVRSVFIGVGRPSTAAILARMVHNPELVLVYESGTIGAKPQRVPLSIGDGELAQSADAVVSVPEMFNYWIGPGRIEVAFLGAAQIDRFANLNSTVIGPYERPRTRLPGAGGAPEIAASCGEVMIVASHTPRTFVQRLDFVTTVGHGDGPGSRQRLGFRGRGPTAVITDLGVLEPDPETCELVLTQVHEGVCAEQVRERTGWDLRVADALEVTEPPNEEELGALRELLSRSGGSGEAGGSGGSGGAGGAGGAGGSG